MFNPPQLKFKKLRKGTYKNKELKKKNTTLLFGFYGLKLLHKGNLTYVQIEAARRVLAKHIKGIGVLWVRGLPNRPMTSKPLEVRMGKGKGNVSHWVRNIKAGHILFEISFLRGKSNIAFMKKAAAKLPIKSKIIYRSML